MNTQQVSLPMEAIVHLLRSLDLRTREEIFKKVFIECDTSPLSPDEEISLNMAEDEYQRGETISWKHSR